MSQKQFGDGGASGSGSAGSGRRRQLSVEVPLETRSAPGSPAMLSPADASSPQTSPLSARAAPRRSRVTAKKSDVLSRLLTPIKGKRSTNGGSGGADNASPGGSAPEKNTPKLEPIKTNPSGAENVDIMWRMTWEEAQDRLHKGYAEQYQVAGEYAKQDALAIATPSMSSKNVESFSEYLLHSREAIGDVAMSRVIFQWLCHHIKSVTGVAETQTLPKGDELSKAADAPIKLAPAFDAKKVLDRLHCTVKELCLLFQQLCCKCGLIALTIDGYAKLCVGGVDDPKSFIGRHVWNAVHIDGEWRMFDVHQSLGFAGNGTYGKDVSDAYFNVDPTKFILSHYPMNGYRHPTRPVKAEPAFLRPLTPVSSPGGVGGSPSPRTLSPLRMRTPSTEMSENGKIAALSPINDRGTSRLSGRESGRCTPSSHLRIGSVTERNVLSAPCSGGGIDADAIVDTISGCEALQFTRVAVPWSEFVEGCHVFRSFFKMKMNAIYPTQMSTTLTSPYTVIEMTAPSGIIAIARVVPRQDPPRGSPAIDLSSCYHSQTLLPEISADLKTTAALNKPLKYGEMQDLEEKKRIESVPVRLKVHLVLPFVGEYDVILFGLRAESSINTYKPIVHMRFSTSMGLYDIPTNRDLHMGFIQPLPVNNREQKRFQSRFTLMNPLNGYFQKNSTANVRLLAPSSVQSMILCSNGEWHVMNPIQTSVDAYRDVKLFGGAIDIADFCEVLIYFLDEKGKWNMYGRYVEKRKIVGGGGSSSPTEDDSDLAMKSNTLEVIPLSKPNMNSGDSNESAADATARGSDEIVDGVDEECDESDDMRGRLLLDSWGRCFSHNIKVIRSKIKVGKKMCSMEMSCPASVTLRATLKYGFDKQAQSVMGAPIKITEVDEFVHTNDIAIDDISSKDMSQKDFMNWDREKTIAKQKANSTMLMKVYEILCSVPQPGSYNLSIFMSKSGEDGVFRLCSSYYFTCE